MLRSSFAEWRIRIGGAAVTAECRLSRLTRQGLRRTQTCRMAPWSAGAGAAPWQAALDALAGLLEAGAHAHARVVLADSLVRYAVLPWNDALVSNDEDRVFLGHRFRQMYGEVASGWDARCERDAPGRARLASAVDAGLVPALAALLGKHAIDLRSAIPALADAVNRHRRHLDRPDAWLVCHDDGALGIARWHDWEWMAARSLKVDADWRDTLAAVLAREECLHDAPGDTDTVFLDADGEPPALPGWTVVPLRAAGAAR
ncbi:hypothetical protein ACCD08_10855 [Telluria sp. Tellsp104]